MFPYLTIFHRSLLFSFVSFLFFETLHVASMPKKLLVACVSFESQPFFVSLDPLYMHQPNAHFLSLSPTPTHNPFCSKKKHTQKKLFISGLSKIQTEPQVELRRAELERAFRKYGGDLGAIVTVPTNTTFAFVEVENERMADVALNEMSNKYRLNRARRSKHEALQEEREAAEKAKGKRKDDAKGWD